VRTSIGASTDVGHVREANEDAYLLEEPLFGIADGMGGHIAGDVASRTAVESITSGARRDAPAEPGALAELVRGANAAILERAQADSALRGMGTTCTLLLLGDGTAHIAHVGDSRAYLLRDGELSRLTDDHTLVNRMVREGRLAPEQADHHPQRSILTRALGVDPSVEVDAFSIEIQEGDRIMLCSDGLSSMVSDSTIADVLGAESDPQSAADSLVEQANDAGGEDNITVVVIHLAPDSEVRPSVEREDTAPEPPPPPPPPPPPKRARAVTRWAIIGAVIAIVAVAGFAAARFALGNSFFVGVDDSGRVTIYSGLPDEVAGLTLKSEEEVTDIDAADLPDFKRHDLEQGIEADSLDHAQEIVESLRDLARDPEFVPDGSKEKAKS
jgi:serine/threonine protein phosphatase PrpC